MKKLYECPSCLSEHSGIASGYEDGSGYYGNDLTPIFDCSECGHCFTGDEGFIGYEGQPDDNPDDDIPFGNPDLNEISGGYDS